MEVALFSEGDLIVRVGSAEINKSKTPQECLKFLDAVIPFIEMPDMPYAKEVKLNGPAIAAVNVAARLGVLGAPIPLKASEEWMNRLKNFKLQVLDDKGTVVGEGQGNSLLGDPLSVVLWIRDSLKAEGKKLKKGDIPVPWKHYERYTNGTKHDLTGTLHRSRPEGAR